MRQMKDKWGFPKYDSNGKPIMTTEPDDGKTWRDTTVGIPAGDYIKAGVVIICGMLVNAGLIALQLS